MRPSAVSIVPLPRRCESAIHRACRIQQAKLKDSISIARIHKGRALIALGFFLLSKILRLRLGL
jgi:hypothetical protein